MDKSQEQDIPEKLLLSHWDKALVHLMRYYASQLRKKVFYNHFYDAGKHEGFLVFGVFL